ncbi:cysteine proteinase [Penicillium chermesinum]|uniref:ubiquitinyl hydrolase 1 n=1 Tax=Penicillium chermesinum TaxID=63820 RepID=A0A9W9NHT5_9EURO|nr:cysteine proteinase [Penicillium chermesinum]KAJ5220061.1 cysteine proteinase [Penicillium chermesinum]
MSNSANANALSTEEMERFQKLSNEFEPDVKGPAVSVKQSSHNIALEYANADPTLAAKTSALALTHPTTRVMRGDGNCGWRAVIFGYFEILFNLRDPHRVQAESQRIKNLNGLLDRVGHQQDIYEIFVDETMDIFTQTLTAIQNGVHDESFLVEALCNENQSNAVITHFRLLTSAWMRLNPQDYQAFLSLPVDQYCSTRIETVRTEIDEVGLQALVVGIIKDAGFGVEILYLDRSEGDAVTPHPLTTATPAGATIRLLYRPGHYDLLYRPEVEVNINPMVNYQYGMTTNYAPWDQGAAHNFEISPQMMAIPNLMADPAFAMGPDPMSPMSSVSPAPASPYQPSPTHEMYPTPIQSHAPVPAVPSIPAPSPPAVQSSAPKPMMSLPSRTSDGPQIRMNPFAMKASLNRALPVTTPFKNSPYNQAHFQNQDFEPIHWEPSDSRR